MWDEMYKKITFPRDTECVEIAYFAFSPLCSLESLPLLHRVRFFRNVCFLKAVLRRREFCLQAARPFARVVQKKNEYNIIRGCFFNEVTLVSASVLVLLLLLRRSALG